MTKMMKLYLALVVAEVVMSLVASNWESAACGAAVALWVWLYSQADRRADAAEKHADNLARLLAAGAHVAIHRYVPATRTLDDIIDDELHGHHPYSQGGIRPHLCVCGKPLEEHQ